jgi:hypothetical protein
MPTGYNFYWPGLIRASFLLYEKKDSDAFYINEAEVEEKNGKADSHSG